MRDPNGERGRRLKGGRLPTPDIVVFAADRLPAVDVRLQEEYGTADLGNKADPLDELVYIQLSIRTREGAYQNIYAALRHLVGGNWRRLIDVPDEEVLQALRAGGMAAVKLRRLREQILAIEARFGAATLDPLREMDDQAAEQFLTSLEGVGKKAARCVLLYSLHRDVFPVDSHCRRVLARLGFLPSEIDRKAADDYLQVLVPPSIRHTLHVNLVHHGRACCLPVQPLCARCPILDLCPTGQHRLSTR